MEAFYPQLPGLYHSSSSKFLFTYSSIPKIEDFSPELIKLPPRLFRVLKKFLPTGKEGCQIVEYMENFTDPPGAQICPQKAKT